MRLSAINIDRPFFDASKHSRKSAVMQNNKMPKISKFLIFGANRDNVGWHD